MTPVAQRRLVWILAVGQVLGLLALSLHPINSIMLRVPMVVLGVTLWVTLLQLVWRHTPVRWAVAGLPLLLAVVLLLPGRTVDTADLRQRIVDSMRRYVGVTYVWGGENALGIDCSGLVRRARIDAEWSYAFAHGDPGAIRRALSLWWNDQSAKSLGHLERGATIRVDEVADLASCAPERYLPGDFAVINDVHVVAALGGGEWIEADPMAGVVLILPPGSDNTWLKNKATLVRWQVLEER